MAKNYIVKIKEKVYSFLAAALVVIMLVLAGLVGSIKWLYPHSYNRDIVYYCTKYGLEESLVRAIIKIESGYDNLATSLPGARGLMQLMPKTADWVAVELGKENFEIEQLYNPKTNIEMGCFYLRYLFDKYDDEYKVLFAYNAGEGVLSRYCDPEQPLIVENIEILETKEYIQRVVRAKRGYERLARLVY